MKLPPDRRDAATRAVDKLVEQGLVDEFQKYNIGQVIRAEYEKDHESIRARLKRLGFTPSVPKGCRKCHVYGPEHFGDCEVEETKP